MIRLLVVEPSVVGLGFHGSTCVLISMLIVCDILALFGAGITLWVFLYLVNKDFHDLLCLWRLIWR